MTQYNYVWRYGIENLWTETPLLRVGASAYLTSTEVESHTDGNSVYVSWDGEDGSGGDGTYALPYRTIQYAMAMMSSNHTIVTIKDSNYYYTGDGVDLYIDINGITIQGMEGQKPILTLNTSIASQVNMIRLQNQGKLINIELQIPEGYTEQVTGIDARAGTIQNVTIDGANKNGIQKTTSGVVTIQNSEIKNCINDGEVDGSGILLQEGTLNLDHTLIHSNDYAGIRSDGTDGKVLGLDHCTVAGNQYGLHVIGSTNLGANIIDSIVYRNKVYDHYGSMAVYSYSCIGKINGSPTLTITTSTLRVNPLFISNVDFNLR